MSFPLAKPWSAPQGARTGPAVPIPSFVQEDTLRNYGSMPEFTRYALTDATRNSLGYQPSQTPVDTTVRWQEIAPLRPQATTFSSHVEKAALELPPHEPTEAGRQFLLDFLQACRERGEPIDCVAVASVSVGRAVEDLRNRDIHSPSAERSTALADTLLASIRLKGQVLALGHPAFGNTLARYLPHMRRILETLADHSVIPSALDWQLADYANRLGRVSQIVERERLAGAEDICRLFIAPEPNATVARQQRDWDQRLAELAPATSGQWQLRRRAVAALAPLLNPQVAQHVLAAMPAAGR